MLQDMVPRVRDLASGATSRIALAHAYLSQGKHAEALLEAEAAVRLSPKLVGAHMMVARIRTATELPIACGFGIGSPEQVRAVVQHADAAIVGSALVRRIEEAIQVGGDAIASAERFVEDLATGLRPLAEA